MRPRVAVVGAGFAGLVAATELVARGAEVTVFEAAPHVGGLARSFTDDDGFSHDFGAHFITNRLADALGVSDRCRVVEKHGEAVFIDGKPSWYPYGLALKPRFATSALRSRLTRHRGPSVTAGDEFRRLYGDALTDEVIAPLIEGWSGRTVDELARTTVEKLPGSMLNTAYLIVASRVLNKAIAIGYGHDSEPSIDVWHVYPEGGVGSIIGDLVDALGDVVRVDAPVEGIDVRDGRVESITSRGESIPIDAVFSTAPVHVLPRLVRGDESLSYLERFRYRPMVFVNLRLEGRGLLATATNWFPDGTSPFFRVSEATVSMPWLAPEGKTILTADYGCQVGDDIWTMDDDDLAEMSLSGLEPFIPDIRSRFLGSSVLRTPIAYPVFSMEYEEDRQRFERGTGIEGLFSIGRNGEFAHILLEDIYFRTVATVDRFIDDVAT